MTVPGVVDGWSQLLAEHGTLPLRQALAPAIACARDGFPVAEVVARQWHVAAPMLAADPAAAATFLPHGRAPVPGEVFACPALAATLEIFEEYADRVCGQFHCFVDDAASMRRIIDLGSLVSFTGIVTFKNAQEIRDTVAATPLYKLMVETDSPFLAPMPYRGKRCEPAYTRHTAETVAEVKNISLAELSAATCATAHEFFPKLN